MIFYAEVKGWMIVVQFYKFEFVFDPTIIAGSCAKKEKVDNKFGVMDDGTMAQLIRRIRCDYETFE